MWYIWRQYIAQSWTCVAMFYSEQRVMWRRWLRPLTCSLCRYVICICYTSRAPAKQIQSTYVTSSSGRPSPAVHWDQAVMWSRAADMGVCSDVNAVTLSLSFLSVSGTLLRTAKLGFWEHIGINDENHQAVYNLRLQLAMFFSFHFPVASVCKIPLVPKTNFCCHTSLCFLTFTSFSRSIFSVHSHALSPSVALPPLQSHWPILWRTVKGRRSVYCLASFLGQWDSADVCSPFFWAAQWNFVQSNIKKASTPPEKKR